MGVAENKKQLIVLNFLQSLSKVRQVNSKARYVASSEQLVAKVLEEPKYTGLPEGTTLRYLQLNSDSSAAFVHAKLEVGKWSIGSASKSQYGLWFGTYSQAGMEAEDAALTNGDVYGLLQSLAGGVNVADFYQPLYNLQAGIVGSFGKPAGLDAVETCTMKY